MRHENEICTILSWYYPNSEVLINCQFSPCIVNVNWLNCKLLKIIDLLHHFINHWAFKFQLLKPTRPFTRLQYFIWKTCSETHLWRSGISKFFRGGPRTFTSRGKVKRRVFRRDGQGWGGIWDVRRGRDRRNKGGGEGRKEERKGREVKTRSAVPRNS
jgi:hypothetical protein